MDFICERKICNQFSFWSLIIGGSMFYACGVFRCVCTVEWLTLNLYEILCYPFQHIGWCLRSEQRNSYIVYCPYVQCNSIFYICDNIILYKMSTKMPNGIHQYASLVVCPSYTLLFIYVVWFYIKYRCNPQYNMTNLHF